jgi:beta-galactosidase
MFHDEDAEVWLNGKLLVSAKGYTTGYVAFPVSAERFAAAAKQGDNVLAVKVVQTIGGQYIDVGLSVDVRK